MNFPTWFVVLFGWGVFSIIMEIVGRFLCVRNIQKYLDLPKAKKDRLFKSYTLVVTASKIYLWVGPIFIIALLFCYKYYVHTEELLYINILNILTYFFIILYYLNRKYLLRMLSNETMSA